MTDDIKMPAPADYIYKCDGTLDVQRIPFYTADQLRAAVLADRAERASAADRKPLTSEQCGDLFDRVAFAAGAGFECDWMDVIRETERTHGIVDKERGK